MKLKQKMSALNIVQTEVKLHTIQKKLGLPPINPDVLLFEKV